MKDSFDAYKVLGIEPGSSAKRVRQAYVELSRKWDPANYITNSDLRASAEKKRKEIEEAYQAISHFLLELRSGFVSGVEHQEQTRDFKEMAEGKAEDVSKVLMSVIIVVALLLLFAWAFYIYKQTRILPPSQGPIAVSE